MAIKLNLFVAFLIISIFYFTEVYSLLEFTNLQCESLDKDFALIDYCFLKSVNRSYKYVSIKVNLLQLPITKVKVHFGLYQRLNGYKPFLYNITFDACRFLQSPKSNPVALYFYNFYKEYSNMNHPCPYDHDIVLDKMPYHSINNMVTKILPFPEGNYMFEVLWIAYDIPRAQTKFYASLS
ncbi:GM23751 [Drosophila sechellia]|uniref:GM23751 n=1 Tax=Drosophila sechellia TaxID=7238 RepID=B4IM62_DROSE|nr:GM23751 [Drosophila sechellia]